MDVTLLNALIVLIASIGTLLLVAYGIRRWLGNRTSRHGIGIHIIARQPITNRASLIIVDVGDRRMLLGVTDHAITLLATVTVPQSPSQHTQPNQPRIQSSSQSQAQPAELSFRSYLSTLLQRTEK